MMKNEPISEVKDRLYLALQERQMKPVDLAIKAGFSKASISQYLSGRVKPTSDRLYILAKALNVDPAWLLGYDVPMEQADTFAPTQSEIRMIRKFRTLDSYSKRTIEMMIDRECERNNTFKPVLMAAHNNETHETAEMLTDAERIDKLD